MIAISVGLFKIGQSALSIIYSNIDPWGLPSSNTMQNHNLPPINGRNNEVRLFAQRVGSIPVLLLYTLGCVLMYIDRGVIDGSAIKFSEFFHTSIETTTAFPIIFTIFYALFSPFFGYLSNSGTLPSTVIISIGMTIFTLGSLTGFACTYYDNIVLDISIFIFARIVSAIGNAAFVSLALAVIFIMGTQKQIPFFIALFEVSMIIGVSIGIIISGLIEWRIVFLLQTIMGIFMSFMFWGIANASIDGGIRQLLYSIFVSFLLKFNISMNRVVSVHPLPEREHTLNISNILNMVKENIRLFLTNVYSLLSIKSYVYLIVGNSIVAFMVSALAYWMPVYYHDMFDMSTNYSAVIIGITTGIAGVIGTVFGAFCLSKVGIFESIDFICMIALCQILAHIGIFIMQVNVYYFSGMLFMSEFLLFTQGIPIVICVMISVSDEFKGFAMAINVFMFHLFGEILAPYVFGQIIHTAGFYYSMTVPTIISVLSCLVFMMARKYRLLNNNTNITTEYNEEMNENNNNFIIYEESKQQQQASSLVITNID